MEMIIVVDRGVDTKSTDVSITSSITVVEGHVSRHTPADCIFI
jgi:hypothetical protein